MSTTDMDDTYDPTDIEPKWRERWRDSAVYTYRDDERPNYIIDTPPPYPTGNLHIGNALGWCYMDFAARYKRLQGFDVLFPQGWDCHGLPTEVKVEEGQSIHRTDIPRDEFRQMCIEFTERNIDEMRNTMHTLGFSHDWNHEYKTMDPDYWGKTQRSFIEMADSDYVYRDEHPVNWCPRCETAIADAEVETIERTADLHTITFPGADSPSIDIATTRPELLAACVAVVVHPEDDRYADRIGDTLSVPLFGQSVDVLADESVDETFGTGAVMICTFGDKQDVTWWAEYDLDLRIVFTDRGTLNDLAGQFSGLSVEEAKSAIVDALEAADAIVETTTTEQSVGTCWRCDTPIEILSKEQWFVRVNQEEILEYGRQVDWIPDHMAIRLEEWTRGMDWDWVISRQRVFATPIPAWYCSDCGHTQIASIEEVPLDPTSTPPAVESCSECDATDWSGETDVMDTWMDSSISPLYVAGWPDEPYTPVQLREQGHDIIRTWAFYTILRTAALENTIPWEQALINGMVFGDDGHKMSKSRGNFVQPEAVVDEHGADAFRQAIAIGGQPGSDIQFQWKEVTSASRFLTKIWNICRFAEGHFDDRTPVIEAPAYRDVDQWILTRLDDVSATVAADMDAYRFDSALRTLREFIWHDLADEYLELVKGRLYEGRPGERDAARHALYTVVTAALRMLAPFSPFLTEERWHRLPGVEDSVHTATWPSIPDEVTIDWDGDRAAIVGSLVVDIASTIRGWKSDQGLALNADLDRVVVYPDFDEDDRPAIDTYDLSETVNAPVYIEWTTPSVELVPTDVSIDRSIIGPRFRDAAGGIIAALESMNPSEIKAQKDSFGEIEVQANGEVVIVDGAAVEVVMEYRAESGEQVAVLEADDATILVFP